MRDDRTYLAYIDDSISLIIEYTRGGKERFLTDFGNQDQVIRRLETIADAAAHLSDPLKERHPEVQWDSIRGLRNRLAHGYLEVDLERVWDAVESLAHLHAVVEAELK